MTEPEAPGRAEEVERTGRPVLLAVLLLLAIVAVVALVLVILPSMPAGHPPEMSRERRCKANLKTIGMACYIYASEHDDYLPFSPEGGLASLSLLAPGDVASGSVMVCPEHARAGGSRGGMGSTAKPLPSPRPGGRPTGPLALTPDTCSYAYLPGQLGVALKTDDAPADLILAYGRESFHKRKNISNSNGGRNVLYADGHAAFVGEQEFQTRLAESKQRYEDYRSGKLTSMKAAPK